MSDPLDLGPSTGDPYLDLIRWLESMASAAEKTIAALARIDGPGEEKRALSAKYAAGTRDAYHRAAAALGKVHRSA